MGDLANFEWPALSTVLRTMYELHTYRSKQIKEEATVVTQVKHNETGTSITVMGQAL